MPAEIILIEDPFGAPESFEAFAHEGPFHEWLLNRFPPPRGFGDRTGHVLRRGGTEPVTLQDWDFTPDDGERVMVVVAPSEAVTISAIVMNLAISIALTVLSMALFPPPDQPAFAEAPKPSPVYSVSYPENAARLNEPLPVLYGEMTTVPDLAMQPYSYYEGNEQFVVALLAVTCGHCRVDEVFAGETALAELPQGVAEWKAYGPDDHARSHGAIGADFGIDEDVVTSPDVSGIELRERDETQAVTAATDFIAPDTIRIHGAVTLSELFAAGTSIAVSGSASNDGSYTVAALTEGSGYTDLDVSSGVADESFSWSSLGAFQDATGQAENDRQRWTFREPASGPLGVAALSITEGEPTRITAADLDEQVGVLESYERYIDQTGQDVYEQVHVLILRDCNYIADASPSADVSVDAPARIVTIESATAKQWAGWFVATKAGQDVDRISLDLEFPAGLYRANSSTGELEEDSLTLRIQYQPVGEDGSPSASRSSTDLTIATTDVLPAGDPLNTPLRMTHDLAVPRGRYRVRVRRKTPPSTAASDQSRVQWSGLKGRRVLQSSPVYAPCTLLAVRLRATAGLSRQAIGRIRARVQRRLTWPQASWDPDGLSGTRSPARAAFDLLCNPDYGLGLDPATTWDLAELHVARERWRSAGLHFDHVFTDRQSAWEALRLALQPALAEPLVYGGKVTIRQEGPKSVPVQLFSQANIVAGSLRIRHAFRRSGDPDGVRVVYRDQHSQNEKEALHPAGAIRPTDITVYGLTSPAVAADLAKVRWKQREGAQLVAEWETELEGRIVRRGDRVRLAWPIFPWGESALLVSSAADALTLDRPVPDGPASRWVILRDDDGAPTAALAAVVSGDRELTLSSDPGIVLRTLGGGREPTHVVIGRDADDPADLVVDEVSMSGPGRARIAARGHLASAYASTAFDTAT